MMKNIRKKMGHAREGEVGETEQLMKVPAKEKLVPSYRRGGAEPEQIYQADLLYMPEDQGFKYLLVCVVVSSGVTDGIPLKDRTSRDIRGAFERMFVAGRPLPLPKFSIHMDSGGEFMGATKAFFDEKHVAVRYGKAQRSRSQAMAENRNKIIAKALFESQHEHELATGDTDKRWVDDVPAVLEALNESAREESGKRLKRYAKQDMAGTQKPMLNKEQPMLEVGTRVRVQREAPRNAQGQREVGGFRATDLRWERPVRTIANILITPRQPIMYQLDGGDKTGYTREQLQVVEANERAPVARAQAQAQAEPAQAQEVVADLARGIAEVEAQQPLQPTRSGRKRTATKRYGQE